MLDMVKQPDGAYGMQEPGTEIATVERKEPSEDRKAHVKRVLGAIEADKLHWKDVFKRMRRDQHVAMHGAEDTWSEHSYRANIAGRHVRQRTATLYAKNPKVKASRPETLDFVIWDEQPESLQIAMATMQGAAGLPPVVDPNTGLPTVNPALVQAQALLADVQQGMARRNQLDKIARSMELLYERFMADQQPLAFKPAMKKVVRKALVNGVGYVESNFEREKGPRIAITEKIADHNSRVAHLENLAKQAGEGEIGEIEAEMSELKAGLQALMSEPEAIIREGLILDFPNSTQVIPDKSMKALTGFVGCGHVTIEYDYTVDKVKELFGVDLSEKIAGFTMKTDEKDDSAIKVQDELTPTKTSRKGDKPVKVWKMYNKDAGMVFYVAEGYDDFLREPAAPEVFVEAFWPIEALVFNDTENEKEPFPPSDVTLILDMQREHNRARQGAREHRDAARPRYAARKGSIDKDDANALANALPFSITYMNMQPGEDLGKIMQAVPVPGVDPNLYTTQEIWGDMQLVAGASEARYGGIAKATATEAAISEGSTTEADSSSIDDLDEFLTRLAKSGGQILLREMSPETVKAIVGPGAVWPEGPTIEQIAKSVFLEIEAGSTGKPNQAVEVANWSKMLPHLLTMPDITPGFLARETLRRLDDKLDFTKAITLGAMSVMAMNQLAGAMAAASPQPGDGGKDPAAQGGKGADNAPKPAQPEGSAPAFGSNQVA
jgi:hypothetical protein